jgi:hypothetical protein
MLKVSYLSGILSTFLTNPLWVLNSRTALSEEQNILKVCSQIYQKEGI